jgi:PKD repeat protein
VKTGEVTAGSHHWVYCTVYNRNGDEFVGKASSVYTKTVASGGEIVHLKGILARTGYGGYPVARLIYRTKAGGSIYYLVGRINDNTTTTYPDNLSDDLIDTSPENVLPSIPLAYLQKWLDVPPAMSAQSWLLASILVYLANFLPDIQIIAQDGTVLSTLTTTYAGGLKLLLCPIPAPVGGWNLPGGGFWFRISNFGVGSTDPYIEAPMISVMGAALDALSVVAASNPDCGNSLPFLCAFTADIAGGTPPYTTTFDFGDGSNPYVVTGSGTHVVAAHPYAYWGPYTVTVTVNDSGGLYPVQTVVQIVTAQCPIVTNPPTVWPFAITLHGLEFNEVTGGTTFLPTIIASAAMFDPDDHTLYFAGTGFWGVFGPRGSESVNGLMNIGFRWDRAVNQDFRLLYVEAEIQGDPQNMACLFEVNGSVIGAGAFTKAIAVTTGKEWIAGATAAANVAIASADGSGGLFCKPRPKILRFPAPRGSRGKLSRITLSSEGKGDFSVQRVFVN